MKIAVSVVPIVCLLWCCSCGDRTVALCVPVNSAEWSACKRYEMTYQSTDSTGLYDLEIFVRHYGEESLQRGSFDFNIEVTSPDGTIGLEQVTIPLSRSKGRFVCESSAIYRRDVCFLHGGRYVFALSHFDQEPMRGIEAVGINIIPTKQR